LLLTGDAADRQYDIDGAVSDERDEFERAVTGAGGGAGAGAGIQPNGGGELGARGEHRAYRDRHAAVRAVCKRGQTVTIGHGSPHLQQATAQSPSVLA